MLPEKREVEYWVNSFSSSHCSFPLFPLLSTFLFLVVESSLVLVLHLIVELSARKTKMSRGRWSGNGIREGRHLTSGKKKDENERKSFTCPSTSSLALVTSWVYIFPSFVMSSWLSLSVSVTSLTHFPFFPWLDSYEMRDEKNVQYDHKRLFFILFAERENG